MKHFVEEENIFTWYSILVILIFNIFDTVGRQLGGKIHVAKGIVIALGIIRLVFIFTTTAIPKVSEDSWINSDVFKILNLVLFSVSNGYTQTQCFIKAPQMVKEN